MIDDACSWQRLITSADVVLVWVIVLRCRGLTLTLTLTLKQRFQSPQTGPRLSTDHNSEDQLPAPVHVDIGAGDSDGAAAKVQLAGQQRHRCAADQQRAEAGRVAEDLVEGQCLRQQRLS